MIKNLNFQYQIIYLKFIINHNILGFIKFYFH